MQWIDGRCNQNASAVCASESRSYHMGEWWKTGITQLWAWMEQLFGTMIWDTMQAREDHE